jgi:hypothetical protein
MSHDIPRPRLDGLQEYPQVLLQCLKQQPILALHQVHSREASLTQARCRERKECLSSLLCDNGVLLSDNQNEVMSVDEHFSFSLLSFLISISSSSAAVDSAESNA